MLSAADEERLVIFEEDATTSFDGLERGLQELLAGTHTPETVNALFRAAHNLKGNARIVGFKQVGELAHVLEELLDRLRNGKLDPTRGHLALLGTMIESVRDACMDAVAAARGTKAASADETKGKGESAESTQGPKLRVPQRRLDAMLDLLSELVLGRSRLETMLLAKGPACSEMLEVHRDGERTVASLQEILTASRLVPIGPALRPHTRTVRELAETQKKEARLVIVGDDAEVDATLIDALKDPLMHMVRNAVDHGLELPEARVAAGKPAMGTLEIRVRREGANIALDIADDGRGFSRRRILEKARSRGEMLPDTISDEALFLRVFDAGFSTAEKVTDVSGRGVGMDVVRKNIEALRGSIAISSTEGKGTTFHVRVPLTLAMMAGFHIGVGGTRFVLAKQHVVECMPLAQGSLAPGKTGVVQLRGKPLPCIRLRETLLGSAGAPLRESLVVADVDGRAIGLAVDDLFGECQTVIKPLGRLFDGRAPIAGSAVLGTGEVALILDVPKLLRSFDVEEREIGC